MKFIALKPARIVTLAGHCVHMEASEERELHGLLAQEAMSHPDVVPAEAAEALINAKKAQEVAAVAEAKEAAEAQEAEAESGLDKTKEIEAAIMSLIAENAPDNFTAQGYPRVAAIMGVTGREDISSTEIREVFDAMGVGTGE